MSQVIRKDGNKIAEYIASKLTIKRRNYLTNLSIEDLNG